MSNCRDVTENYTSEMDANVPGNRAYECRVLLIPEQEGGFSALATQLPGVASQGETEDEAIENVKEAFQGVLEMYLEERGSIPWSDIDIDRSTGSERWILVHV